jgi:hypothetical protein
MAFEELELSVHLWRRTELTGIFLCYQMVGLIPAGLHGGGSRLFSTDFAIDEALRDAHMLPSLVESDEKAPAVLGLALWQLVRLGLEPQKAEG